MSLYLDKTNWTRVRFGDVAKQVKTKVDPESGAVDRYVAGEHMESDELRITRWGTIGDGYLGPAFHAGFRAGQVLYGSRRTYLRKVALADFDGVCANTTFVVEVKNSSVLLPDLLPFVMSTEAFHAHSKNESKGSVNPYVNWPDLAKFELDLPPTGEQRRVADLLWAAEKHRRSLLALTEKVDVAASALASTRLGELAAQHSQAPLRDVIAVTRPLCYGVVQPGIPSSDGIPLIRVCDLEPASIDLSELRTISKDIDKQYSRSRLQEGDVLLSVVGTLGRIHVATAAMKGFNIARAIARIAPDASRIDSQYLAYVLRTTHYQTLIEKEAFESARKTLNLGALGAIEIPLPPLDEQHEFLAAVEIASQTSSSVENELTAVTQLRVSLLNDAMGGAV